MQTQTNATKKAVSPEEEKEDQQASNPRWWSLPEWAPKAILCLFGAFLACVALLVGQYVFAAMSTLHSSQIPWWGVFFIYTFIIGILLRGRREFPAWVAAAKSKWGVINRWVHSLT